MQLLKDRIAIVTGSATGLGEGIARLFVENGARVAMLDRSQQANEATASDIGPLATPITCDVSRKSDIDAAVARVVELHGRVDIVVNNAGIYPAQSFMDLTEADWDLLQTVNVKSMMMMCQSVLPHMMSCGMGKIVNMSSGSVHYGVPLVNYTTSKAAVLGFTRALAREMGIHGIHINCVTPGTVKVSSQIGIETDEEVAASIAAQSLKRRILPIDIARVCLFLSTELSDGMTGQSVNVDGGWIMH